MMEYLQQTTLHLLCFEAEKAQRKSVGTGKTQKILISSEYGHPAYGNKTIITNSR